MGTKALRSLAWGRQGDRFPLVHVIRPGAPQSVMDRRAIPLKCRGDDDGSPSPSSLPGLTTLRWETGFLCVSLRPRTQRPSQVQKGPVDAKGQGEGGQKAPPTLKQPSPSPVPCPLLLWARCTPVFSQGGFSCEAVSGSLQTAPDAACQVPPAASLLRRRFTQAARPGTRLLAGLPQELAARQGVIP